MGGFSNWPSYDTFISQCWGPGVDVVSCLPGAASNIVFGANPPYYPDQFLAFYPKFGGIPLQTTGTTTQGSNVITAVLTTSSTIPVGCPGTPAIVAPGQLLVSPAFPPSTIVTAVTAATVDVPGSITVNNQAISSGTLGPLTIYVAPFVPLVVLLAYIQLATASLVQARWQDMWTIGIGLYVAHFATLYLQSDGNIYTTAGQAATAGIARGITVSKTAGPVSQGIQALDIFGDWGSFALTSYGQQLATFSMAVGAGPVLLY